MITTYFALTVTNVYSRGTQEIFRQRDVPHGWVSCISSLRQVLDRLILEVLDKMKMKTLEGLRPSVPRDPGW